jgi:hypothetical protein
VNEAESGLDYSNIFLDLSRFNTKYSSANTVYRIGECKPGWVCEGWFEAEFAASDQTGDTFPISVTARSQDDAGNPAAGETRASFVVDKDAPSIEEKNMTIKAITDLGEASYYQSGDKLWISANISDYTPVTAVADFSAIMGIAGSEEGNCDYDEITQKSVCEWEVGPILNGYKKALIKFNFTDFVGNTKNVAKQIEILATGNEASSLWRIPGSRTVASSNLVDRRTALLMNEYPVYFSVPLFGEAEAKMLSIRVGNCVSNVSTGEEAKYYFTDMDPEMINDYAYGLNTAPNTVAQELGNVYPVLLKYTISTSQPMPRSSIVMNCKMNIISRWNGAVTPTEVENVSLEIKFYDSTFGPIEDEALERMHEMWGYIDADGWKFVDGMKKALAVAKALCTIIGIIEAAWDVISNIWHIYSNIADKLPPLKGYAPPACAAGGAGQTIKQTLIEKVLEAPCKMASCRMIELIPGFGDIWQKYVMNNVEKAMKWTGFGVYKGFLTKQGKDTMQPQFLQSSVQNHAATEQMAENSIVWAGATLCLPAIIKFANRFRQIECKRYYCYETIPSTGVPMKACEDAYNYDKCRFFFGELFNVLPIGQFMNMASGLVKNALSNPWNALTVIPGLICTYSCGKDTWGLIEAWMCDLMGMANTVADIVADTQGIIEQGRTFALGDDLCDQITPFDKFLDEQTGGNSTG